MPSFSDYLPGAMALAGVSMMLIIMLKKYFRYQGRLKREARRETRLKAKPRGSAQRAKLEAPHEVKRWEVEFHETCRDLQAELDSKMRALQILIIEANAATERLEQAKRDTK